MPGCLAIIGLFVLIGFFGSMCSHGGSGPAAQVSTAPSFKIDEVAAAATPADEAECLSAKKAMVAARKVYDREYERENPGVPSATEAVNDFNACRLVPGGAFVGKWGGQRWKFIPKHGSRYVRNPHQTFESDTPMQGQDRWWFYSANDTDPPVAKRRELSKLLAVSRKVE